MRYFIQLAYKGTDFHGWQLQANANSVQAELEKAFSAILRQPISIMGSGRTETGVHAEQQFAHFEVMEPIEITGKLLHALNSMTPFGIAIQTISPLAMNTMPASRPTRVTTNTGSRATKTHF